MKVRIRKEEKKDYKKVEELMRDAFWNLYFPGCHEHFVLHKMRKHKDYIKDLAFLIEVDGKIIGGIFYTHSKIITKDNKEYKTITFGPIFISPEFQRKGFGRQLITHSTKAAEKMGYRAILILGYEYHYTPYGFLGGKKFHISMPDGTYKKGLLALPLYKGALDGIIGSVKFSDVFTVTQKEVDQFDLLFAYKEKKYQKSQDEFKAAVSMLDES